MFVQEYNEVSIKGGAVQIKCSMVMVNSSSKLSETYTQSHFKAL